MSIVVCDPIITLHRKHIPHLMEWYAANKAKHDLVLQMEIGRPLHKVQQNAVKVAQEIRASHVLFTEHDHWGYPVDGLDVLLEHDREVIGLQSYQRGYPFMPMQMRKVNRAISFLTKERNLQNFHAVAPVEETDLITWAFTLVRTSVFDRIDAAGIDIWVWDEVPTDSHFCQACEDLGIPRYVCQEGVVNHGDVDHKQIPYWRRMFESLYAGLRQEAEAAMPAHDEDHAAEQIYETEVDKAIREAQQGEAVS